jgi:hypothetical protein
MSAPIQDRSTTIIWQGKPSHHFLKSDVSLPEDGQSPSPESGCVPIYEDLEDMSDLKLSPLALRCSGLCSGLLNVPIDMTFLAGPEPRRRPGVDLESSLPRLELEPKIASSPAAPTSETLENNGEGSEISLPESFSRTGTSLSSNYGNPAPSQSLHIEKPYARLGPDFVDVEDYLVEPSSSFPEPT